MSEKQKDLCATSASSETEYPTYGSSNSVSSTSTPPLSFERTFPDERSSPPSPCSSARQLEREASHIHCLESTDRKDQREASGFEGASSQPARSNSSQKKVEVKLEDVLKRVNELEKIIRDLTEQVSRTKEVEQQNERLRGKLVRIEGKQSVRLDTTLQEKDKLDRVNKQLECLFENAEQNLEQLEKENQVLEDKEQLSAEINTNTKQLENKLKDLADRQEPYKQLKSECDTLIRERINIILRELEATREDPKLKVEEAKSELVIAEKMHTELEGEHTQQINELEDKLTESEEVCQELEGERNELRRHVILVDEENAKLTQDNENLTRNLTKKEEECKKLTTTVTKLTSELNAMSRHEKDEKQASRTRYLESTDRKEASGFEGASSQPARSNSSQKRVEVKLEEAVKRVNELEKKRWELTEQVSRVKEIEQQNERLKRKLVRIEGKQLVRLDTTLQEKDKLDREKKQLECLYEDTIQKLEQLEKEKQVLHEALKDKDLLKGNLQQLSAEMDAKTKRFENKLKDLADLQEQCKQLKNDGDTLMRERNEMLSKVKAREEEAKIELVIAEEMHTELERKHTQQINELEDKLTESEEACQELEGESNELQTCMILVDGENARLTQDNENLTQNLTKKEEECKKLTTMVTKLMSELNAMSRHVGVEKEEKQAVGSELKTVEAERDKYLQQRDVARRSLAQRNMEYSALETQTQERQAHYEAEIRRLRVELSESNSERLRLMALCSPASSLAEQPQANETLMAGNNFARDPRFCGTSQGFSYSSDSTPPGGQSSVDPSAVHPFSPSVVATLETKKIKFSEVPPDEYFQLFKKLFTKGMAVKKDIAKAILKEKSTKPIHGVAFGIKEVKYEGESQCRQCIVVLVEDVAYAREHMQKVIAENVIKFINSTEESKYEREEDPFWLTFECHTPEFFETTVPVMNNEITNTKSGAKKSNHVPSLCRQTYDHNKGASESYLKGYQTIENCMKSFHQSSCEVAANEINTFQSQGSEQTTSESSPSHSVKVSECSPYSQDNESKVRDSPCMQDDNVTINRPPSGCYSETPVNESLLCQDSESAINKSPYCQLQAKENTKDEPLLQNSEKIDNPSSSNLKTKIVPRNQRIQPAPLRPGSQIVTDDGVYGTVGLFVHADMPILETKYFGVTCAHVCFDGKRCNEPGSIVDDCILRKLRNELGLEATLYSISSYEQPYKVQLILQNMGVSETKGVCRKFECILYGLLSTMDEEAEFNICTTCNHPKIPPEYKNFIVDIALFSLDSNVDTVHNMEDVLGGSWELWTPDKVSLLDRKPPVYTYNERILPSHTERASCPSHHEATSSPSLPNACTRKSRLVHYGQVTSLVNGELQYSPPHVCVRPYDSINDRLFADDGDSGSLLFIDLGEGRKLLLGVLSSVSSCHRNCTSDECCAHSLCRRDGIDCISNPSDCQSPTFAYGFFIQPALDVLMNRRFRADVGYYLEGGSNEDLKRSLKEIPPFVAAKSLIYEDMEYSYSPCINEEATGTSEQGGYTKCRLSRRCLCPSSQ